MALKRLCIYSYQVKQFEGVYYSQVNFLDWLELENFIQGEVGVFCRIDVVPSESDVIGLMKLPQYIFFDVSSIRHSLKVLSHAVELEWFYIKLWQTHSVGWFYLLSLLRVRSHVVLVGDSAKSVLFREDIIRITFLRKIVSEIVLSISKDVLKRADQIVCVSENLRKKYIGARTECIVATESWLEEEVILKTKVELSKYSRLVVGDITLLYVGRVVFEKGLRELLSAMSIVLTRGQQVRLIIVGSGKDLSALKELVRELGLDSKVNFVGHIKNSSADLYEFYRMADVFVLPSYSEGTPLSILEAFGCGTLVVANNVGGISDMLDDGRGILLNSIRPDDLAMSLESVCKGLIDNPLDIQRMVKSALVWASWRTRKVERRRMYGGTFDVR